jgi:hypothetical protein
MPKPPDDTKPESWQRFFASSANNVAWQLAELPATDVDVRQLLNAAHAAAWHWESAGNELNQMRALMLLAQAHALAGLGTTALRFADRMRSYFLATQDTPDWEIAFVHVIHAHAACVAGAAGQHASSFAEATRAVGEVADAEDRELVQRIFRQVPAP